MNKLILAGLSMVLVSTVSQASSELPTCEFIKKHMADDLGIQAECTKNYVAFCKKTGGSRQKKCTSPDRTSRAKLPAELKIAGFNMYNLGMEADFKGNKLTQFKSTRLLSDIVSKNDLVAAIELKHFDNDDRKFNEQLASSDIEGVDFRIPPYLEILTSLLKEDSSWALVLSTDLFGVNPGDTMNNELSGYFFRRKYVTLKETEYCDSVACTVPTDEFDALVARKPFIASFKAGSKDFTMAAVHFRYRPPTKNVEGLKNPVLDEEAYAPMLKVYNFEKHTGFKYDERIKAQKLEKQETHSRFSEVKSVSNFLGKMINESREKDVLLFGDFNLMAPGPDAAPEKSRRKQEKQDAFHKAWFDEKGVLENFPGARPYVNDLTTLGKDELVNRFDHFVFAKEGHLSGCDTDEASAFDFTDSKVFPEGPAHAQELDVESYKEALKAEQKFKKNKLVPRYSEGKIGFLGSGYQKKLIDSFEEGTNDIWKELISDHLPIQIKCKLK